MQDTLQQALDWVADQGMMAPVLFVIIYVVSAVAFVPGSILTLSAGVLFGVVKGTVLVSAASTTAAAISLVLARFALRGWVERKIAGRPAFRSIDEAVGREGWKIFLLLRLSPVFPFTLLNYSLGLTRIGFWPAVLSSWIGMLPGTILYVYIGSIARLAAEDPDATRTTFFVIGLLATLVATVWITRIARKALSRKIDIEVPSEP